MTDPGLYLFFGLMAVFVLDLVLSTLWFRPYYRWGIPIFRRTRSLESSAQELPSVGDLTTRFGNRFWSPIVFRRIAPNTYAFRHRVWGGYTPVMYGVLTLDTASSVLTCVGKPTGFILAFTVATVLIPVFMGMYPFSVVVVGVILGVYYLETKRFERILDGVYESMDGLSSMHPQ